MGLRAVVVMGNPVAKGENRDGLVAGCCEFKVASAQVGPLVRSSYSARQRSEALD
jgi:hypothetical protein